ncbi:MAG: [Clostridia bacterium]|nr:[FeFe] hydrogenase H-cluster maturation GTPase HydF [Clostridia bacterium]
MGLQDTVSAERLHIAFFGVRNAGKSSLVNAVTGQDLSVVSDVLGTTTDPVKKAMELLPLGPVLIIDTPGIDDEGELGAARVEKTKRILDETDLAVLVVDATRGRTAADQSLIRTLEEKKIPYIVACNKCDLMPVEKAVGENEIYVSARTGYHIKELKDLLGKQRTVKEKKPIAADLVRGGDTVILVTPIDEAAPKGRLILPQQQTIRDLLESGVLTLVCRPAELGGAISALTAPPALVITDSQAFAEVAKLLPPEIPLTSFSILFARYKGDLKTLVKGAAKLDRLRDGDRVLISEGCTHHRQCNDIGSVKLPKWLAAYTGKDLEISLTSGGEFPEDLRPYALVIHCGGCMLNERQMQSRIERAVAQGVAVTNYGVAIAQMHGILRRTLSPFPQVLRLLDE